VTAGQDSSLARSVSPGLHVPSKSPFWRDHQTDDHLQTVRPAISAVAALSLRDFLVLPFEVGARQVIQQHIKLRSEQVLPALPQMLEQPLFWLPVGDPDRGTSGLFPPPQSLCRAGRPWRSDQTNAAAASPDCAIGRSPGVVGQNKSFLHCVGWMSGKKSLRLSVADAVFLLTSPFTELIRMWR
jgi:hypothetical protein